MSKTFVRILAALAVLLIAGCAGGDADTNPPDEGRTLTPLVVSMNQTVVLPTSVLEFELQATERMVASRAEVHFVGRSGTGAEVDVLALIDGTDRIGDQGNIVVKVPVEFQVWPQIDPSPNAVFNGSIEVRLIDQIGVFAEATLADQTLTFRSEVEPTVQPPAPGGTHFVNADIPVTGENFLRASEGTTWGIVNATLVYSDGRPDRELVDERVAVKFGDDRQSGLFPIDPGVFGISPASIDGTVRFENELRTSTVVPSSQGELPLQFTIEATFLSNIDPAAGSRGQRVNFRGRGFVPNQDGERFYGMLFRFEGELIYDSGGSLVLEDSDLERSPDSVISDDVATSSVWYEIADQNLIGLGAEPGTFTGEVTPVIFDRFGEEEGVSVPLTFRVLPTRQVVHLKYLPSFFQGLSKYGLQNVERDIRERIMTVVTRDYEGINVEFRETLPTDFIDFATIEIGGPDPTGGGKFGYDNTCNPETQTCKDTDNLYLADYLGGVNRSSAEEFNTPFGGIFIESFDFFSPTLNPGVADTSEEFDRVLSPFMPALEGTVVRGTEWPDGPRADEIAQAIHMVGSVIGNTISHEIGHSLGLSFYPSDRIRPGSAFHNRISGDNQIMDPGSARPFEERAELGLGPAVFNDRNREYLLEILPIPQ